MNNFLLCTSFISSGPKGISTLVVEKGTPGLSFGKKERKVMKLFCKIPINSILLINPLNPKIKIKILLCRPLFIYYRSSEETLIKYQATTICVIMS